MPIHESGEDYLESILKLGQENGPVRSIDVATDLGYSKPSVSIAMKRLREEGYVEMDTAGLITLTPRGTEVARRILNRHRTLTAFFVRLGVDPAVAEQDACKVEHDLSDETFEKLLAHAAGGELPPDGTPGGEGD